MKDILVDTEQTVREEADIDTLLADADKHAKELISGLFADLIGEDLVEVE